MLDTPHMSLPWAEHKEIHLLVAIITETHEGKKGEWYGTSNCDQSMPYVCKLELKTAIPDWSDG